MRLGALIFPVAAALCMGTEAFAGDLAKRHFVAYCGRYEVNEAEGSVLHRVETDVVPNSAGSERKRYISLRGDRLVLRPAEQVGKDVVEYTLTWERVDKAAAGSTKAR